MTQYTVVICSKRTDEPIREMIVEADTDQGAIYSAQKRILPSEFVGDVFVEP